jgi:hypothetical protein
MSKPLQTSDRTAFHRFAKLGMSFAHWEYADGDFYAIVSVQGGCWAWVVWLKGRPIGGRRDVEMDAFYACKEALGFIGLMKGEEAPP